MYSNEPTPSVTLTVILVSSSNLTITVPLNGTLSSQVTLNLIVLLEPG